LLASGVRSANLESLPITCPQELDTTAILEISGWERLTCFGDEEIELTGVTEVACQGGVREGTYEPAWLADWCPPYVLTDRQSASASISGTMILAFLPGPVPPDVPTPAPGLELTHGSIVHVTGHFDDPAAHECRVEPSDDHQLTQASLRILCRERFVVTALSVIGDLDLPSPG
jgi:hypothetical protein